MEAYISYQMCGPTPAQSVIVTTCTCARYTCQALTNNNEITTPFLEYMIFRVKCISCIHHNSLRDGFCIPILKRRIKECSLSHALPKPIEFTATRADVAAYIAAHSVNIHSVDTGGRPNTHC